MEISRGFYNIQPEQRDSVITIGNFDGMHKGHIALLDRLKVIGQQRDKPTMVITFEPQPPEYFSKKKAGARLMLFRDKVEYFASMDIDYVLCLPFNSQLAHMQADDFIRHIAEHVAPNYILIGDDFCFGHERAGDIELLKKLSTRYHFDVAAMPTFADEKGRVSSSRVRQSLEEGDLVSANELLGRPFTLQGKVAQGHLRGRQLGFPTANIHLHREKTPLKGVFAVEVTGIEEEPIKGVANVGIRPTFSGEEKVLLEVHLFNFNQDIYGQRVAVHFLHKLREEQKFPNIMALQQQISLDVEQAKKILQVDSL